MLQKVLADSNNMIYKRRSYAFANYGIRLTHLYFLNLFDTAE